MVHICNNIGCHLVWSCFRAGECINETYKNKNKLKEEETLNIKEAYKIMSKASGIEVGDTVKVLRNFEHDEMGCRCQVDDGKDKAIGGKYSVTSVDSDGDVFIDFPNEYTQKTSFPFFCLELISKATKTRTISLDGKTKEISEESFQAMKELFEEAVD